MTSISMPVNVGGRTPNPTPPGYDNDRLSHDSLTETVSRARALGIPVDLLDTARPTVRAQVTDAIDDAWRANRTVVRTRDSLASARSEQGAWWPMIPGAAGGALAGTFAGLGTINLLGRFGASRHALLAGVAVGAAITVGGAFAAKAMQNSDANSRVANLTAQLERDVERRDQLVVDAIEVASR